MLRRILELMAWLAPSFIGGGGGGGGSPGPDPYESRKKRLAESETQVNRIFGVPGETQEQRLARLRDEFITSRLPVSAPVPRGVSPYLPSTGVTVQRNPAYGEAMRTSLDAERARAAALPALNTEADSYIAAERARGPGQFTPEWYEGQRTKFVDAQMPELDRQYRDRSQKETLWAWGRGLGQSTEAGKSAGALQRALEQSRAKVLAEADSYVNELRGKVETARNNAITMGGDSDPGSAARFAGQQAELLSKPAPFSVPADFFSNLSTPAALAMQAGFIRGQQPSRTDPSLLSIGRTTGNAIRSVG